MFAKNTIKTTIIMAFFNPLQLALKPLFEQAKAEDELFANEVKTKTESKKKSWEECCEYIMGEAYEYASKHKNGNCGMAGMSDADMIGLIKHYYDEDKIEVKKMSGAKVNVAKASTNKTTSTNNKPDPKKTDEVAVKVAINTKAEEKPKEQPKKEPSKADMKKGADCYDLFSEMFG